jgi:hypothetical protein
MTTYRQEFESSIASNVTFVHHMTSVVDITTAKLHTSTPTQPPATISTITSLASTVLQTNGSSKTSTDVPITTARSIGSTAATIKHSTAALLTNTTTNTTTYDSIVEVSRLGIPQLTFSGASAMYATTDSSWNELTRSITSTASISSINQRGSCSYEFAIEGHYSAGESSLETPSSSRTEVAMVLMTPIVYEESPYVKVRIWPRGKPFGGFSSSTLELVISRSGLSSQRIDCGSTSNAAGKMCAGLLDSRWFDGSSTMPQIKAQISNLDSAFATTMVNFTVVPQVEYVLPSETYMWLELPTFTLLPGTEFEAILYGNTREDNSGAYALALGRQK